MSSTTTIISISVVIAAVYLLTNLFFPAVEPLVYYHYCSPPKHSFFLSRYFTGSSSESNVNSLLNLFVNSAALYTYNNFTVNGIYGLYQCRGDLSSDDCASCVEQGVHRFQTVSAGASGCALQLEGCLLMYDNVMFIGVPDKTVMVTTCGMPAYKYNSEGLTRTKSLVDYLVIASSGTSYRVGRSGEAQAVAQCTGDLSVTDCQYCLVEAIHRLRLLPFCGESTWGDVYLAKCYVGYSSHGYVGHEHKKQIRAKQVAMQRNYFYQRQIYNTKSVLLFTFYVFLFLSMYFVCFY